MVVFDDPGVVEATSILRRNLPSEGIILHRSHDQFRKTFHATLAALGLQDHNFQPYSLRRGGATTLWGRTGNFDLVRERGRWADPRTARVYLTEGLQWVHEQSFEAASASYQARLATQLDNWLSSFKNGCRQIGDRG